jgi:subtilisin family serine protease
MRNSSLALFLAVIGVYGQEVADQYILELSQPPIGKVRGAIATRNSQANARAALAARFGAGVRVLASTELVMNALAVRTNASPSELAAVPGVSRVWPVYAVQPEVMRAAELQSVVKAWQSVGGSEKTGAGIKIGIVDSGLEIAHPAFSAGSLSMPEGFPKASSPALRDVTNGKVIVYRSYEKLYDLPEIDADRSGHGTAVAMVAAGGKTVSPIGELQGFAPGAWLGIYKVFGGPEGDVANSAGIVQALDDAVADGMDVVNLSLGLGQGFAPQFDPLQPAIDRAASLGLMVIKSMGNSGPARLTGTSPFVGSAGIVVGASTNGQVVASGVRIGDRAPILGIPSSNPPAQAVVSGTLFDVSRLDPSGLACSALPQGSLTNKVALILRGECLFEAKLLNAQGAGAIGALVYTHAASPNAIIMNTGSARLPAMMISNEDGLGVKAFLSENPEPSIELSFQSLLPFPADANRLAILSSRGPGVDEGIRPDLVAIGQNVYTAAQGKNPRGAAYDPSGFTVMDGTSFAAPMVAGAFAAVKSARPGLRNYQYRSLLITATDRFPETGPTAAVQNAGSGRLNVDAALHAPLSIDPPSISFRLGGQRIDQEQILRIDNIALESGAWRVYVNSDDAIRPSVQPAEFLLSPKASIDLRIRLNGELPIGETQGFLVFEKQNGGPEDKPQRLAYWYGVPSGTPSEMNVVPAVAPETPGRVGEQKSFSVLVTDRIGAVVPSESPRVTVVEGSGVVLSTRSSEPRSPGYWQVNVRLGQQSGQINRFRIELGTMVREVSYRTE